MEHIPLLSSDLIKSLQELYPVVLPTPVAHRETELYSAGQRSVVDFLLQLLKESEESISYENSVKT